MFIYLHTFETPTAERLKESTNGGIERLWCILKLGLVRIRRTFNPSFFYSFLSLMIITIRKIEISYD